VITTNNPFEYEVEYGRDGSYRERGCHVGGVVVWGRIKLGRLRKQAAHPIQAAGAESNLQSSDSAAVSKGATPTMNKKLTRRLENALAGKHRNHRGGAPDPRQHEQRTAGRRNGQDQHPGEPRSCAAADGVAATRTLVSGKVPNTSRGDAFERPWGQSRISVSRIHRRTLSMTKNLKRRLERLEHITRPAAQTGLRAFAETTARRWGKRRT